MEKTSFSVLFYICKTKTNCHSEAPLSLRATVNGQRKELRIHRFINPKLWNTAKGKAVENGKGCKELNLYLDAILSRLLRAQHDLELEGLPVTATTVPNLCRANAAVSKTAKQNITPLLFSNHP